MTELRVGVARAEITPSRPLPLAGFAHRSGPSEGVSRELFARALLFENGPGNRTLLVSADLIWWGPELVERLRRGLLARFGLPGASVILHATHTHSGPQTTGLFSPLLGVPDPEYLDGLVETVLGMVARAAEALEPVTVERSSVVCSVGVNRRRTEGGKIVMAPNPDGPVDPEVSVVRLKSYMGGVRAVLVHYTCHPTTTDDNLVSSEFPGSMTDALEGHLGEGAVALYLQGCCGDVRPSLVRNGGFYRGTAGDVERLGGVLAERVVAVLERPMATLPGARMVVRNARVPLPLQGPPGKYGPESESLNPTVELEVVSMRLADQLSILALNAEPVVEYGLWTKRRFHGRVLPIGYSNGMIGYLPTASQVDEGGYEARDSAAYFGLPAPFDRSLEVEVKQVITNIIEED